MIKIYLDVYFFVNFCIDYIAVYTVSTVCHRRSKAVRLIAAALLGSLTSILLYFIDLPVIKLPVLIIASCLICRTAFSGRLLYPTVTFWCVGIFLGGMLTSLEGILSRALSSPLALLPAVISAVIACVIFKTVQSRLRRSLTTMTVNAVIRFGESFARVTLLVDSGNLAREPVSDRRIIFLSRSALQKITLPDSLVSYPITLKGATGIRVAEAFEADEILFEKNEYGDEKFLVLPDPDCEDFAGYDGLAPLR